jgi:hemolysin III
VIATLPPPAAHIRDQVKPRLRGVIHQWAALATVITGSVLVSLPQRGSVRTASAIYAVSILGLFTTSAVYHRRHWVTAKARAIMRRLDHSMIFVFIAGTYTPLCVALLHGTTQVVLLAVVWGSAGAGVVTSVVVPHAPRWITVPLYVALGWVAVFVLPEILHGAGVAALVLLCVGGVFYSLGGLAYGLRRPEPWPGVFGYHEVFHTATVVAAACHYIAVMFAVVR